MYIIVYNIILLTASAVHAHAPADPKRCHLTSWLTINVTGGC